MAAPSEGWRKGMRAAWKRRHRRRAAVPFEVMKALAAEALPLDKHLYSQKLSELIREIESNSKEKVHGQR